MRLDTVTVALRPRTSWEAADLGIALVRRHASPLWRAWLGASLPLFVVANAACVLLEVPWLAALLMWWLKPAFDRIPLHVVSRAVFGATPSARETLGVFWRSDWRAMLPWLTWRRLHPARATLLPIDLLERLTGPRRRDRVRVISREPGSNSVLLTVICAHIEAMLAFSIVSVGLLFVPVEFFSESAQALYETMFEDPPPWAQVLANAVAWAAVTIVEPFYVGAGFGIYLNRRTQIECWDIELSFRRIAARFATAGAAAAMLVALLAAPLPGHARTESVSGPPAATAEADAKPDAATAATSLETLFGDAYRDDGDAFERAVAKAYEHPDLGARETVYEWRERKRKEDPENPSEPSGPLMQLVAAIFAGIAKYGLWIVAGVVLWLVARSWRSWWPKLRGALGGRAPPPLEIVELEKPEALPDDPVAAARGLWDAGRPRAALGLLYRAAVAVLARRLDTALPPGATEAECLRHARAIPAYAPVFAKVVAHWRAAAYADRLPAPPAFDALLRDCGVAFEAPR